MSKKIDDIPYGSYPIPYYPLDYLWWERPWYYKEPYRITWGDTTSDDQWRIGDTTTMIWSTTCNDGTTQISSMPWKK